MWFSTFCFFFVCCCFVHLSVCNSLSYIQIFWQLFPPFIVLSTQTSACFSFVCALCRLIMVTLLFYGWKMSLLVS